MRTYPGDGGQASACNGDDLITGVGTQNGGSSGSTRVVAPTQDRSGCPRRIAIIIIHLMTRAYAMGALRGD